MAGGRCFRAPLLEPIFAPKARHGYLCSSPVAAAAIKSYGFLTIPNCGSGS
jgi:hypothetical protein